MPSSNGNLKVKVLHDVEKISIPNGTTEIKNFSKPQFIIRVFHKHGEYPLAHFPTNYVRLKCAEYIQANSNLPSLTLDTNMWHSVSYVDDIVATAQLKSMDLFTALKSCVNYMMMTYEITGPSLTTLDAFVLCPPSFINNVLLGVSMPIKNADSVAKLWGKTLPVSPLYTKKGISKYQFWKILINKNNEIFNSANFYSNS